MRLYQQHCVGHYLGHSGTHRRPERLMNHQNPERFMPVHDVVLTGPIPPHDSPQQSCLLHDGYDEHGTATSASFPSVS